MLLRALHSSFGEKAHTLSHKKWTENSLICRVLQHYSRALSADEKLFSCLWPVDSVDIKTACAKRARDMKTFFSTLMLLYTFLCFSTNNHLVGGRERMMQNLSRAKKKLRGKSRRSHRWAKVKWNCVKNIYDNSQNIGSGMRLSRWLCRYDNVYWWDEHGRLSAVCFLDDEANWLSRERASCCCLVAWKLNEIPIAALRCEGWRRQAYEETPDSLG